MSESLESGATHHAESMRRRHEREAARATAEECRALFERVDEVLRIETTFRRTEHGQ